MSLIIDILAKQIVNLFPKKKLYFVGIATFLSGILSMLTTTSFVQDICKNFNICIEGNKSYGIFLAVIGFIIIVARRATELYENISTDKNSEYTDGMGKIAPFIILIFMSSCSGFKMSQLGFNCGVTIQDECVHAPKMCIDPKGDFKKVDAFGPKSLIWENKDTILYYFMDGQVFQKQKVRELIPELNGLCRIVWKETAYRSKSDMRISFKYDGSWSYKGNVNSTFSKATVTTNFGWITKEIDKDETRRVVHHEFMHFLGLCHEHQHPKSGIMWDTAAVYNYYSKIGWTRTDVDNNLFSRYSADQTNFTDYDDKSIMHYPISAFMTTNGYSVGWNRKLSDNDKKWLRENYPIKLTCK